MPEAESDASQNELEFDMKPSGAPEGSEVIKEPSGLISNSNLIEKGRYFEDGKLVILYEE